MCKLLQQIYSNAKKLCDNKNIYGSIDGREMKWFPADKKGLFLKLFIERFFGEPKMVLLWHYYRKTKTTFLEPYMVNQHKHTFHQQNLVCEAGQLGYWWNWLTRKRLLLRSFVGTPAHQFHTTSIQTTALFTNFSGLSAGKSCTNCHSFKRVFDHLSNLIVLKQAV